MKPIIRYSILFSALLLLTLFTGVRQPDPNLNVLDQMTLE
jgi:hypothetical protein